MAEEQTLREWVAQHKVCWELSPLVELVQRPTDSPARVQVGFELQLYGEHVEGIKPSPGCAQCVTVYDRLRSIALFALPKEQRPSRYDLSPFDSSFHLRPESDWVPEVQLTIRIIHGSDYFNGIDDCEKRCADEIQGQLRALGAQPKAWPKGRSAVGGQKGPSAG